jgi:hypothetical protein
MRQSEASVASLVARMSGYRALATPPRVLAQSLSVLSPVSHSMKSLPGPRNMTQMMLSPGRCQAEKVPTDSAKLTALADDEYLSGR